MIITGNTRYIAHIGYPTHTFKSPMIYNPYFEHANIDAVVIPFASQADDYPQLLKSLFTTKNIIGALITMPHKISTTKLVDILSPTAQIAGACNAVRLNQQGLLEGDMFDGEGFVRGMKQKGYDPKDKKALVIGSGGVGSAIAASLAAAGVKELALYDLNSQNADNLGKRLQKHYPNLIVHTGHNNPQGYDIVVNATPLGMNEGDDMPLDVSLLTPDMFVGEVVLKAETTAFLAAAQQKGCQTQVGTDMLFEQIPAYLEYFGLPTTNAQTLRELAQIRY